MCVYVSVCAGVCFPSHRLLKPPRWQSHTQCASAPAHSPPPFHVCLYSCHRGLSLFPLLATVAAAAESDDEDTDDSSSVVAAFDRAGMQLWAYTIASTTTGLACSDDGVVYVAVLEGTLHALDAATGTRSEVC